MRDYFLLDPDVVFLNHGSFGACPRPVFEAYQAWQRDLEHQPVEFLGRRFDALMDSARAELGAYINADPDDVIFVPNATAGLNIAARSLQGGLEGGYLRPGDEILTSDHEYGALDYTWEFVCRKTGAQYLRHPAPLPLNSTSDFVETFWGAVTPRTRIIFLSHITSPTALIFPIAEIIRRARAAGIMSIIDGAHAPGQIPLDMRLLDPDMYSGNLHKWFCAPKGTAFLYVRKEHQSLIEPAVISWGEHGSFVARNQWQGTRDIAGFLSVPAAIAFQREYDWDSMRRRCHDLAVEFCQRMTDLTSLPPTAADSYFMQMATARLPACHILELKRRLYDEYKVEIPVGIWNNQHLLRASFQAYNTPADLEALMAALEMLLPEVLTASDAA